MESEDYAFYQGLVYLMDNMVEHLGYDLSFSTEVCVCGFRRYFFLVHSVHCAWLHGWSMATYL